MTSFYIHNPLYNLLDREHPTLYTPAIAADIEAYDLMDILREMKKVVKEKDGAALAAPQIGVSRRIIYLANVGPLLNPVITNAKGGMRLGYEECLSAPGERFRVRRWNEVTIECTVPKRTEHDGEVLWEKGTLSCTGYTARVIQHEIDHLDGICVWTK